MSKFYKFKRVIIMSTLNKVFGVALMVIAFSGSSNATLTTVDNLDVSFTYDDSLVGLFGKSISKLALTELGDYTKEGPTADVIAKGTLTTNDLTNGMVSITKFKADTVPFPPASFEGNPGAWKANANAAFSKLFSVETLLHNTLGNLDDFASINKIFVGLTITKIPLPQAVWLFGAGLMGLLSISKRKKLL